MLRPLYQTRWSNADLVINNEKRLAPNVDEETWSGQSSLMVMPMRRSVGNGNVDDLPKLGPV